MLLSKEAARSMVSWEPSSDRIITAKLRTRYTCASIIHVYVPTEAALNPLTTPVLGMKDQVSTRQDLISNWSATFDTLAATFHRVEVVKRTHWKSSNMKEDLQEQQNKPKHRNRDAAVRVNNNDWMLPTTDDKEVYAYYVSPVLRR